MNERGFTLLEALVVMGVLSILVFTSISSYAVVRQRVYDSISKRTIHDARTAIEAARGDLVNSVGEWFWGFSDANGNISTFRNGNAVASNVMLPGMEATRNTRFWVSYDTWCTPGLIEAWGCLPSQACCITESIQAVHCKGKKVFNFWRWNNGDTWEVEWDNWGAC